MQTLTLIREVIFLVTKNAKVFKKLKTWNFRELQDLILLNKNSGHFSHLGVLCAYRENSNYFACKKTPKLECGRILCSVFRMHICKFLCVRKLNRNRSCVPLQMNKTMKVSTHLSKAGIPISYFKMPCFDIKNRYISK